MIRTAAMLTLITVALLSSSCVSITDTSLPVTGSPIILLPGSHYSAFSSIELLNRQAENALELLNRPTENAFERGVAAEQKHRTPRAQPPPHRFLIKPVATGRLTSRHGYRINPLSAKPKKHNGIDYAATRGTDVFAAGAGEVVHMYRSKSYGNYIRIRHTDGYSTAYAHLNNFAKGIKVGTQVMRGQTIGAVGSTGRSTGNHLHFELIYKGRFVDPLSNRANTEIAENGARLITLNPK